MTHGIRTVLSLALLCLGGGLLSHRTTAQTVEPVAGQPGKDVVWVPTAPDVVEKMLDLAKVTATDVVMDLGSGDGRNVIAAARRGARAIGVEYNPDLVVLSQQRAKEAGVADKATFVQGDMYQADISKASVLMLFLTPEVLDQMVDKFLAMKPGSRIVLNTFPVTDWEPDLTEKVGPPCTAYCTALLVVVPARVAGIWQAGDLQMNLRQDFQFVRGQIGRDEVSGRLRGDSITLKAGNREYSGRVTGDRIEGMLTIDSRQTSWSATKVR